MKHICVVGLGKFGYYLATHLFDKGHEILAIDKRPARIQEIRDRVSRAVVADATDKKVMESLEIGYMDDVIVCIGSSLSDSILASLNLIDIGAKHIVGKVISEAHGRILNKIGVMDIVFPEKDMAVSEAEQLHNPNMLDYMPFIEGYSIIHLAPPKSFIGKTLRDLNLINNYGIQVIGVKELVPERVSLIPTAQFVLKDSDIMILLGPNEALDKLREAD
ncbi:MAG: TrkA family potassium uptake protein [Desulfobacterales bacterium]|nr:TrkA family potassium uptake protein [Desulfobacterales bacterium]